MNLYRLFLLLTLTFISAINIAIAQNPLFPILPQIPEKLKFDSTEEKIINFADDPNSYNKTYFINEVDLFSTDTPYEVSFNEVAFLGDVKIYLDAEKVGFYSVDFQKNLIFDLSCEEFTMWDSRVNKILPSEGKIANCGFGGCSFIEDVKFDHITFSDFFYFTNSQVKSRVRFQGVTFGRDASFDNIEFSDSGKLLFDYTTLPDTIRFENNFYIPNTIDLSVCNYTDSLHYNGKTDVYFRPHYISLLNSDISKFKFEYKYFILWFGNDASYDQKTSVYEALLKNFSDRGQADSYKRLDIEYQMFKWKNSKTWWLGWFPRYWWNFGYNKEYVFYWSAGFLILFTFITFLFYNNMNGFIHPFNNLPAKIRRQKWTDRLWYSFVYTFSVFFKLTLKVENINFNHKLGATYLFIMYTIGLICLAYMANFVLDK